MTDNRMAVGTRVSATVHGEEKKGTVAMDSGSGIVFVRWDGGNGMSWAHKESLTPARTLDERIAEAAERGRCAGAERRVELLNFGYALDDELPEWSPLSGEWAGESIPELLGDLLDEDADDVCEIEDAYESAALAAYNGEED